MMGTYFLWRLGMAIMTAATFALFAFVYHKIAKFTRSAKKRGTRAYEGGRS